MAVKKTETTGEAVEKRPVDDRAFWEEKVPIKLPLNPGNPDDQTVFVSVNDYRAQILRGKEIMVPRYVAAVLQQSEDAEMEAFMKRTQMNEEYEREASKYSR